MTKKQSQGKRGVGRRTLEFIPNDPYPTRGERRPELPLSAPRRSAGVKVKPPTTPGLTAAEAARLAAQTRQALLYGLRMLAAIAGRPLAAWHPDIGRALEVRVEPWVELNAYYGRTGLEFGYEEVDGARVSTCESQDVVCHEEGHAFLDALRPDLANAPFEEVAAFHESFADCIALLTALEDEEVRRRCLSSGGPAQHTLVCDLGETMGLALVRRLRDPAMMDGSLERPALRCANNHLEYVTPSKLGDSSALTTLTAQCHNFSRVFTGALYSSLLGVYNQGGAGEQGLLEAARLVGGLLLEAVGRVPLVPEIYAEVGRRMVQADIQRHGGRHAQAVDRAFAEHGMPLGAPRASVSLPFAARGRPAALEAVGMRLGGTATIEAEAAMPRAAAAATVAHVQANRPLELSKVSAALAGVYVMVPGSARLELAGGVVMGMLGEPRPAGAHEEEEAAAFVRHLCARGAIGTEDSSNVRLGATRIPRSRPTHVVRDIDGRRTLVRVRFA